MSLTSSTGAVQNDYKYDEYGNIEYNSGSISNPFRYSGEYYDDESGLQYLRARYYNPRIRRFISEDTYKGDVMDPLTLNYYAYCAGNPIRYVDPSGNSFLDSIKGLGSGLAESITFGVSNSLENKDDIDSKYDYYNGKRMGNLIAGIFAEIGKDGGGVISGTGVGALAGVPVAVYSVLVQGYSAGAIAANTVLVMSSNDYSEYEDYEPRIKKPKQKRNTPTTNKAQNKQFKEALKEIENQINKKVNKKMQRRLHDEITKEGLSYEEIIEVGVELFRD